MKPYIIGIAGGSCSGKTTLIMRLKQIYGDKITFLSFDDYFNDGEVTRRESIEDWEDPTLYRHSDYMRDLIKLQLGKSIELESNSRESRLSGERFKVIEPKPVIIIEGFLIFHWPEATQLYDKKIFLDISEPTMIERRLKRSIEPTRWDDPNYIKTKLVPGYIKYVLPQKQSVDFVIDGEKSQDEVCDEVSQLLLPVIHRTRKIAEEVP